jgi:hypothetical protein
MIIEIAMANLISILAAQHKPIMYWLGIIGRLNLNLSVTWRSALIPEFDF